MLQVAKIGSGLVLSLVAVYLGRVGTAVEIVLLGVAWCVQCSLMRSAYIHEFASSLQVPLLNRALSHLSSSPLSHLFVVVFSMSSPCCFRRFLLFAPAALFLCSCLLVLILTDPLAYYLYIAVPSTIASTVAISEESSRLLCRVIRGCCTGVLHDQRSVRARYDQKSVSIWHRSTAAIPAGCSDPGVSQTRPARLVRTIGCFKCSNVLLSVSLLLCLCRCAAADT